MSTKQSLHPRNRNREKYDLAAMCKTTVELSNYIIESKRGEPTINFSNPKAVRVLNRAILQHYYQIQDWAFPEENLCPPIPGRAEYIHQVADLLTEVNQGIIPRGKEIKCLDIGTGASCIYPIIGTVDYDWTFIASDIDPNSIKSSNQIIRSNEVLKGNIKCVLQPNPNFFFKDILSKKDKIELSICNPPFHATAEKARMSNTKKVRNLTRDRYSKPSYNFAGVKNELVYKGGELAFVSKMIQESALFQDNCAWFTSLISKEGHVKRLLALLKRYNVTETKLLPIQTGNKKSRILCWSFLSKAEQFAWFQKNGS